MLAVPFLENTEAGRIGFVAIGVVVLVVAVRLVRATPGLTWVAFGLAAPAVALQVASALLDRPGLLAWSAGFEAAFYFHAAGSLIAYMTADRYASSDELFAAAATFTLLAWGFAYLFLLLQTVQPGSFTAAVNPGDPRSWTEAMYLSFAILSGVGLSDIIPISPIARSLCALEMFVGVIYLAAFVSRLIGLTVLGRATKER